MTRSKVEVMPLGFDTIHASAAQLFTDDIAIYTRWREVQRMKKKDTNEVIPETIKIGNAPFMVGRSTVKSNSPVDPQTGEAPPFRTFQRLDRSNSFQT